MQAHAISGSCKRQADSAKSCAGSPDDHTRLLELGVQEPDENVRAVRILVSAGPDWLEWDFAGRMMMVFNRRNAGAEFRCGVWPERTRCVSRSGDCRGKSRRTRAQQLGRINRTARIRTLIGNHSLSSAPATDLFCCWIILAELLPIGKMLGSTINRLIASAAETQWK